MNFSQFYTPSLNIWRSAPLKKAIKREAREWVSNLKTCQDFSPRFPKLHFPLFLIPISLNISKIKYCCLEIGGSNVALVKTCKIAFWQKGQMTIVMGYLFASPSVNWNSQNRKNAQSNYYVLGNRHTLRHCITILHHVSLLFIIAYDI